MSSWPLITGWPLLIERRSPGRPMTRLTKYSSTGVDTLFGHGSLAGTLGSPQLSELGGWKTTMSPRCGRAEVVGEAVHEHALAGLERRLHRPRRDHERLDDRGLHALGEHERERDRRAGPRRTGRSATRGSAAGACAGRRGSAPASRSPGAAPSGAAGVERARARPGPGRRVHARLGAPGCPQAVASSGGAGAGRQAPRRGRPGRPRAGVSGRGSAAPAGNASALGDRRSPALALGGRRRRRRRRTPRAPVRRGASPCGSPVPSCRACGSSSGGRLIDRGCGRAALWG